jgi:hypothetical protein
MKVNPVSQLYTFFSGTTAQGATSDDLFRGFHTHHMIQVSTVGATAQTFTLYTSADGNVWSAIRDNTDVDSTVAGYTGTNASGVINLIGSYPYFRIVTGSSVSTDPFTATIYSTNRTIT